MDSCQLFAYLLGVILHHLHKSDSIYINLQVKCCTGAWSVGNPPLAAKNWREQFGTTISGVSILLEGNPSESEICRTFKGSQQGNPSSVEKHAWSFRKTSTFPSDNLARISFQSHFWSVFESPNLRAKTMRVRSRWRPYFRSHGNSRQQSGNPLGCSQQNQSTGGRVRCGGSVGRHGGTVDLLLWWFFFHCADRLLYFAAFHKFPKLLVILTQLSLKTNPWLPWTMSQWCFLCRRRLLWFRWERTSLSHAKLTSPHRARVFEYLFRII